METALRLASALVGFWSVYWYISEGRIWLKRVLVFSEGVPSLVRVKALSGAGWLALHEGDLEQAERLYQEGLKLYQTLRRASKIPGMVSSLPWLIGWLALREENDSLTRSLLDESRALAKEAGDTRSLASLLLFLSITAIEQGKYTQACSQLEESLALFEALNDKEDLAWLFLHLGRVFFAQGDATHAHNLVEKGLALSREMHYTIASACALYLLGRFALDQGDASNAQSQLEESLKLFRAVKDLRSRAHVLSYLAKAVLLQGDEVKACTLCADSVALFRQMNDTEGIMYCLQGFGGTASRQGKPLWAARLWGAAETLRHASNVHVPLLLPYERTQAERANYQSVLSAVRAELGVRAFARTFAEGQTMTPEQAIALRDQPQVSDQPATKSSMPSIKKATTSTSSGLTSREVEVLRLIGQGLTNAQTADALIISSRTVDAHLRSIYSKLNMSSRHAAVRYALEHHLV